MLGAPGSNSACGELRAAILLLASLLSRNSACWGLRAAILLVGSSGQQSCLWRASLVVILLVGSSVQQFCVWEASLVSSSSSSSSASSSDYYSSTPSCSSYFLRRAGRLIRRKHHMLFSFESSRAPKNDKEQCPGWCQEDWWGKGIPQRDLDLVRGKPVHSLLYGCEMHRLSPHAVHERGSAASQRALTSPPAHGDTKGSGRAPGAQTSPPLSVASSVLACTRSQKGPKVRALRRPRKKPTRGLLSNSDKSLKMC